jgi:Cu/Ag efflux pump CusA
VLLFLFLNARTAFWVAAGIPVAMLAAIAVMYAAGMSLNMISLFALIITLGIVVDDAIVVGEHADYRFRTWASPHRGGRERRHPHGAAGLRGLDHHHHRLCRADVIGGRFGEHDRRYPAGR